MPKQILSDEQKRWKKWFARDVRIHIHRVCPQCGALPYRPCINQVMAMGVQRKRKNSRAPSRARYRGYVHAARKSDE